jgi:hypothetical protein
MMKAEIKDYLSTDVEDIHTWSPTDLEDIFLSVDLMIGIPGKSGADNFSIVVASPQALKGRYRHHNVGKLFVVNEFKWAEIFKTFEHWVAECEGADWMQLAACLGRRFDWEFEGYRP